MHGIPIVENSPLNALSSAPIAQLIRNYKGLVWSSPLDCQIILEYVPPPESLVWSSSLDCQISDWILEYVAIFLKKIKIFRTMRTPPRRKKKNRILTICKIFINRVFLKQTLFQWFSENHWPKILTFEDFRMWLKNSTAYVPKMFLIAIWTQWSMIICIKR